MKIFFNGFLQKLHSSKLSYTKEFDKEIFLNSFIKYALLKCFNRKKEKENLEERN